MNINVSVALKKWLVTAKLQKFFENAMTVRDGEAEQLIREQRNQSHTSLEEIGIYVDNDDQYGKYVLANVWTLKEWFQLKRQTNQSEHYDIQFLALLPAVNAPERAQVIPSWSTIRVNTFNANLKGKVSDLVNGWKKSKKLFLMLDQHLTEDGTFTPMNPEAIVRLKQMLTTLSAFQNAATRYLWYAMFRRTCKAIQKKLGIYMSTLRARGEDSSNPYHYYTTYGMYINGLITAWPHYMPNIRWGGAMWNNSQAKPCGSILDHQLGHNQSPTTQQVEFKKNPP